MMMMMIKTIDMLNKLTQRTSLTYFCLPNLVEKKKRPHICIQGDSNTSFLLRSKFCLPRKFMEAAYLEVRE